MINDYPGIFLMADGKMIEPEGDFLNNENPENHEMFHIRYKFDLEGYEKCNDFTLQMNGVSVVRKDETLTVPIAVEEGEHILLSGAYYVKSFPAEIHLEKIIHKRRYKKTA